MGNKLFGVFVLLGLMLTAAGPSLATATEPILLVSDLPETDKLIKCAKQCKRDFYDEVLRCKRTKRKEQQRGFSGYQYRYKGCVGEAKYSGKECIRLRC